VYPGPIGAILTPQLGAGTDDPETAALLKSLPFASSLCGSCTDVCPVRIDLHHQLLTWRGELAQPLHKRIVSRIGSLLLRNTMLYRAFGWLLRKLAPVLPNPWTRQRDLPPMPAKSFRAQWRERGRSR
jgi:L-lactate dehydrogenase complex protein LldF